MTSLVDTIKIAKVVRLVAPAMIFFAITARAQVSLDSPIPVDSAVTIGQLDNGLTYYLRENNEPAARLELRLAVNAGSVLEDEDQLGLAHFVEHMLFNGTRRFPKQSLIAFLQRIGMEIGPDINAYTSFDETVYLLQVPTDSMAVVRSAFQVLEDWAAYATLSGEEIDNERGVVIEEWRSGRGAAGRMRDQVLPVILGDSRYAERLPIGDTLVLKHSSFESVRRYYHTWYRPDLMAVAVVGDLPVEMMEQLVKEHFGTIAPALDPIPRPSFGVPHQAETRYKVASDPEYASFPTLSISYRQPLVTMETVRDYRHVLVGRMASGMLSRRLSEIAQDGTRSPFLIANAGSGELVRDVPQFQFISLAPEDSLVAALRTILIEAGRAEQHGFTDGELTRQTVSYLRSMEQAYNERNNTPSAALASAYVYHFLELTPIPGPAHAYGLAKALLPTITLDETSDYLRQALSSTDRVVTANVPEKPSMAWVTEDVLAETVELYTGVALDPYVDDAVDAPLLSATLLPAPIISEGAIPELSTTEITLGNGIRVAMKPTDFKADEVRFAAFSEGGTSLYSDEEYQTASFAGSIVAGSGVGAFDQSALRKKLTGKRASVSVSISGLFERMSGRASPQDLEILFQLIHLYATQPRADSSGFLSVLSLNRTFLANRQNSPEAAFADTLRTTLYMNHPRNRPRTVADLDGVDMARALAIYKERFADMDDFTFIFVGAFDTDTLTALAQTYLGTLPGTDREETWRDFSPITPEGTVVKTVFKGQEPKSRVNITFNGSYQASREARHHMESLEMVLDIMLFEELREALGGVYGASVSATSLTRPREVYRFSISFGCDPERADELTSAVFDKIEEIKRNGVPEDYVGRVQEQQRQSRTVSMEQNGFWVSALRSAYYRDSLEAPLDILRYDELVDALTSEDLQQAARTWLTKRYVQVTLLPE